MQQRRKKSQNPPGKRLTKIFNEQLPNIYFYACNKKNQQNHKINTASLKENKIHTLVSKLLTENVNESKKTVHHKLVATFYDLNLHFCVFFY